MGEDDRQGSVGVPSECKVLSRVISVNGRPGSSREELFIWVNVNLTSEYESFRHRGSSRVPLDVMVCRNFITLRGFGGIKEIF